MEKQKYTPPANAEVEMRVLSAMLMNPEAWDYAASHITQQSFFYDAHANIFTCIINLEKIVKDFKGQNHEAEIDYLCNELKKQNLIGKKITRKHLISIKFAATTSSNIKTDCAILSDLAQERFVWKLADKVKEDIESGKVDPYKAFAVAQQKFLDCKNENAMIPILEHLDGDTIMKKDIPAPTWIVEDIISEGLTLAVASPKIGKTRTLSKLSDQVSQGQLVFNRLHPLKCDVLYLDMDDSLYQIKNRMIIDKHTVDNKNLHYCHLESDVRKIDTGLVVQIEREIKKNPEIKLVVIDVFASVKPTQEKKGNAFYNEFGDLITLKVLAANLRIAIVVVHHTKKGDTKDDLLDQISGTKGLTACADGILLMWRKRGATLLNLFRTGKISGEKFWQIDTENWDIHEVDNSPIDLKDLTERELEAYELLKEGRMTCKELANQMGLKEENARKILQRLKYKRELVEGGERKDNYVWGLKNKINGKLGAEEKREDEIPF